MTSLIPSTPQPSPLDWLYAAAVTFGHLALNAPKEGVEVHFDEVRSLLLEVMMGSLVLPSDHYSTR